MATVSESISTLLSNVQNAASEMVGTVNGYTYFILNDGIEGTSLVGTPLEHPPTVGNLPAAQFTAPTELLAMLDASRASLEDVGADIPLLSEIINLTDSTALDSYLVTLDKYRGELQDRMSGIVVSAEKYFPFAGAVRQETEAVSRILSPLFEVPQFAIDGFSTSIRIRGNEAAEFSYRRALAAEIILNAGVTTQIDALTAQRSLLETKALLDFASTAMQGAIGIIRKTIVSPEDIVTLFRQLSQARTSIATGIAENRSAYAGTHMEYINALLGYYDLFADLEKVRLESLKLGLTVEENENEIKAVQLAGAAAASAATAAAGYSATRVGVVLSDKAFS